MIFQTSGLLTVPLPLNFMLSMLMMLTMLMMPLMFLHSVLMMVALRSLLLMLIPSGLSRALGYPF